MKKTHLICLLLAVCVVFSCFPAHAEETISLELLAEGIIHAVGEKSYMTTKNGKWVLMDLNGQEVNGDLYESLYTSNFDAPYYVVGDNDKHRGVVWEDGTLLFLGNYTNIISRDENWVAAKNNDTHQAEVYYQGRFVASFDAESISTDAHGSYLYCDKNPGVLCVDSQGTLHTYDQGSYTQEYWKDQNGDYIHLGSGQKAFVSSCDLKEEDVENAFLLSGRFILDLQGNIVSTKPESMRFYNSDGPVSRTIKIEKNGKTGLMDVRDGIILEPIYDDIMEKNTLGTYLVKMDDQIQYVDAEGNTIQSIRFAGSTSDINGWLYGAPFLVFENMGSKVVFTAAAGRLPDAFEGDYWFNGFKADSVVLIMHENKDNTYGDGLIDVYGNTLLPAVYYDVSINERGTMVCAKDKDYNYFLYRIVRQPIVPDEKELVVWVCPVCHEERTTNFCSTDGTQSPYYTPPVAAQ